MKRSDRTEWPPLDAAYMDEFGHVELEVYNKAGELWESFGEQFAHSKIDDVHLGLELMLKAAANVSRVYRDSGQQIENLPAYLLKAYKRLLLAELKKQNGRLRLASEHVAETAPGHDATTVELENKIDFERLCRRMDRWMREILELLILGYTFEEIGLMRGESGRGIGNKYNRKLKRLVEDLNVESEVAAKKSGFGRAKRILLFVASLKPA